MSATRLNPTIKYEDVSVAETVKSNDITSVTFNTLYCTQQNYLFKQLIMAWPHSGWVGAIVSVATNNTWNNFGLIASNQQVYTLTVRFFYLD